MIENKSKKDSLNIIVWSIPIGLISFVLYLIFN